jgi:hypothetical protein
MPAPSKTQPTAQAVDVLDPRRSTRTFEVFSKGVTVSDIDEMVSALMFDLLSGKLNHEEAAAYFSITDHLLHVEGQRLKEMNTRLRRREMTIRRAEAVKPRQRPAA